MIRQKDLLDIRHEFARFLPDKAEVYRRTWVKQTNGSSVATSARVAVLPCRLGTMSDTEERVHTDRLAGAKGWMLTFDFDADVRLDDYVVVNGHTIEIAGTDLGGSYPMSRRVLGRETQT